MGTRTDGGRWSGLPTRDAALPRGACAPGSDSALGLSRLSVSVLVLVMPPVKVYIESYDATGGHAGDQRPGKADTGVRGTPVTHATAALP